MHETELYVLDTNIFIEAANRYYAFDIAPKFWGEVANSGAIGNLVSIDKVRSELYRQKDAVSDWIKANWNGCFCSTSDAEVLDYYIRFMEWARNSGQFKKKALHEFAKTDNADAWIVAFAKAKGGVVVTHEVYNSATQNKIKIPHVCQEFGVTCIDTFEMLRRINVRWT